MLTVLVSCVAAFIIIYIIQSLFATETRRYKYRYRGWWFIYLPKWIGQVISIRIRQFLLPRRLNFYDSYARSYELCGIVPNAVEAKIEAPTSLITDRHEDGMMFLGGDKDGRMIVAKVVRLSKGRASVFLMVKDGAGNLYTLPNQPDTNLVNVGNEKKWVGNGLLLECVEPMRTWRVKFNGLLRKGVRDHYITESLDDNDDSDSDEAADKPKERSVIHVRFDFLWKAMKSPVDLWRDASSRILAHSLAREAYAHWSTFKSLEKDGYDQWGALHGTIKIGGTADLQLWYLRGPRQHRWGMSDSATNLQKSISLFSWFESGDILCLEGFSFKSGISHCVMGYMQTASGFYHPVTSSSLELSEIHDEKESFNNIFVSCTVGGKNLNLWWRLFEGMSVYTGDPWTLKHELRPSHSVSTNHGDGWGFVLLTNKFGGLCPVPERETLRLPPPPLESPSDKVLVLPFTNKRAASSSLSGGKGASLSSLKYIESNTVESSLQFNVPNGAIVTNHAWIKQVGGSPELKNGIAQLEKAVGTSQINKIKEECLKLRTLINSLKIKDEIKVALNQELKSIFKADIHSTRFAVRSSACGEDSSDASSAGQNETILGCSWSDDDLSEDTNVLRAIIICWSSQFSFQSVEYRRQRGQPMNGGMAVVVQEMVEANAAGVIFTRDPVTGSSESVVISANYGLGESVVSASAEPDTIHIRRTWRNKMKISSKVIGEKKSKFIMKDNGGTEEVTIKADERKSFCLADETALKLAKISIYIEDYFGSPRDIEFALNQGRIYLLQARPITFLEEWTEYELTHELDTAYISDKEICTLGNIAEVFNGYITPLTLSMVLKMLDCSLQSDFVQREWPFYTYDPLVNKNFFVFSGHCLLNVGELIYRGLEENISMVIKSIDLGIWGRLVTTPKMHQWALNRFGVMSFLANIIRTTHAFKDVALNSRRVKSMAPVFSSYEIDTSRITSADHLFKEISRRVPELSRICGTHCRTSSASTMTQCIALVTLAEKKGEVNAEMIQDMASLLACISRTESAEVPTSLKILAKSISKDDEVEDFLQMTPDEGKVWLESHPERVGELFRNFLCRHGHRCIKEFELRTLSWELAPETLVATLQTMVRNPSSFAPSKEPTDLDHVFDHLNSSVTSSKRRALKFILKLCGGAVNMRETSKSLLIKTVDAFRKAYRTLGQLMVLEGRLPDPDLIFFLQHKEIDDLLETRSVGLVTKAIRRKKMMTKLEDIELSEITYGVPTPITRGSEEDSDTSITTEDIRGTPVCTGIAKGTARVITSLNQAAQIQNGDILVTYCTDVGWTPYFPLLAGVVTEIGGLISHGAVVAREYGLPCVVGVRGATTRIKSGETVLLNGKEGFLKRISENTKQ